MQDNQYRDIEIDFSKLLTNQKTTRFLTMTRLQLRKAASAAVLTLAVLATVGPTLSICASSGDDPLKSANGGASLSRQQGSDLLTLQTFQTSPFVTANGSSGQAGYIEHHQTFEELARDLSIDKNYALFRDAASKVLDSSKLCGSGSNVEDRLKTCANEKPDEFAAVSNMLRSYFEWQGTELNTLMHYYSNKLISPILSDRIEGRLVGACLREQLATKDTAAAYDYCRKASNWPVKKTFYAGCTTGGSESDSSFDYKDYTQNCVISNIVKDSLGAQLYLSMIPNFTIKVDSSGVTYRSTPFTETPASLYHLIYDQTYSQITSSWFQGFATQGCLPSVFAPKDFADKVLAKDGSAANYYSICLPQQLLEQVNALPKIDREFFNSIIAKRIATIQVIELLNGSTLIAEETHRNLMAADRELGTLVESFPRYMNAVEKMYKEQIDLVHGKKLDDILEKISSLMQKYSDEASKAEQGQKDTVDELIRLKNHRATGE